MTAIDTILGARIERRRACLGLSRAELARCTGLSERTVAALEAGMRRATTRQLFQLAGALDVPVTALFPPIVPQGAAGASRSAAPVAGGGDGEAVIADYDALSDPAKEGSSAFWLALRHDPEQSSDP